MAELYVGTSGFSFDEWKGAFYPEKIKPKEMLPFYAKHFSTVEINYTFRQNPSPATMEGWKTATPDSFRFTIKAHQRITHILKLANAEETAKGFVERSMVLGDKLGTILFQCPPFLKFEEERLRSLLDALPKGPRYVFEFRHPSWVASKPLLAEKGAAYCLAETDEEPVATDLAIEPAPFHYLRLRKTAYDEREIALWAKRVQTILGRGEDVFCYFKHEDEGIGPKLATALMGAVSKAS